MSTVSEQRVVRASPDDVYAVVSDPVAMAGYSPECHRVRWVDPPGRDPVGARFRGSNRLGLARWSTTATVTDATPGRRFAYDVAFLGLPVSSWSYELEATEDGTLVRESSTDRRSRWLAVATGLATGVRDRGTHNREGMRRTLDALATALEARTPR